jgi:hypothetical protein
VSQRLGKLAFGLGRILDAHAFDASYFRHGGEFRVDELGPWALSATSWAVRTYDADNEARRTHRVPVARKIGEDLPYEDANACRTRSNTA